MKRNAFTLVELLVVITIIALLAGLAVPAIGGALDKAKQTADVVNARQLGLLLFTIASDENGIYPTGGLPAGAAARDVATKSTGFFDSIIKSKELTEPKLVWSASALPKEGLDRSNPQLGEANIAFQYVKGLTSNDYGAVPLLISRGAVTDLTALSTEISLDGDNIWKKKGFVIYTIGNSADWKKADSNGTVKALYNSKDADLATEVTLLKD